MTTTIVKDLHTRMGVESKFNHVSEYIFLVRTYIMLCNIYLYRFTVFKQMLVQSHDILLHVEVLLIIHLNHANAMYRKHFSALLIYCEGNPPIGHRWISLTKRP